MAHMVTWIPSIYPSHVSIYTSTMDPSWVWNMKNLETGPIPLFFAVDVPSGEHTKSY